MRRAIEADNFFENFNAAKLNFSHEQSERGYEI